MTKPINKEFKNIKIGVLCENENLVKEIKVTLSKEKFNCWGTTNSNKCIKEFQKNDYDILIIDYLIKLVNIEEVIKTIVTSNNNIYVIILINLNDFVPEMSTLKELNIYNFCIKTKDLFTSLLLAVYSGYNSKNRYDFILSFNNFGKNLQELRINKNLTQEMVSNVLGIERGLLSKFENGKRFPNIETIQKLAEFYEISFIIK